MSANGLLAVGDRVRRLRGRSAPGTVVRVVQEHPYQMVEVSWDLVAHPFDRVVIRASELKRLSEDEPSAVNTRHFSIGAAAAAASRQPIVTSRRRFSVGDRVERLGIKRNPRCGTVVRNIQDTPQVVEVSWDSEGTPRLTPEMSQAVRLVPQEQDPDRQADC